MYRDTNQRDFARALRNEPSSAEKRLWHFLRAQRLHGYTFRRQAVIGPYVVDFACFSLKLIVELDSPQHLDHDAVLHDTRRTAWLAARGFRVIRFRNQELDEDIRGVVDKIRCAAEDLGAASLPSPAPPRRGERVGRRFVTNAAPRKQLLRRGCKKNSPAGPEGRAGLEWMDSTWSERSRPDHSSLLSQVDNAQAAAM